MIAMAVKKLDETLEVVLQVSMVWRVAALLEPPELVSPTSVARSVVVKQQE
jgi:hypothetical protein